MAIQEMTGTAVVSPMVKRVCPECTGVMRMGEVYSVTRNEEGKRVVSVYLTLECGSCGFISDDMPKDYH